jgi:hypothetical protein
MARTLIQADSIYIPLPTLQYSSSSSILSVIEFRSIPRIVVISPIVLQSDRPSPSFIMSWKWHVVYEPEIEHDEVIVEIFQA